MPKMSREFVRRHRRLLECREGRREANTYKSARVINLSGRRSSGRATSSAEAIRRSRLFVFACESIAGRLGEPRADADRGTDLDFKVRHDASVITVDDH